MENFERADKAYEKLIEDINQNNNDLSFIYDQLGKIKYSLTNFLRAIKFYQKALQIQQQPRFNYYL
jgi:tetratricopeptide (TPR) repeat protein